MMNESAPAMNEAHPLYAMNDPNPIQEGLKVSDTGMKKDSQDSGYLLKLLMSLMNPGPDEMNEGELTNG